MKTKDLIAKLQKEDPTGEEHVCVGNVDISFISNEPAYWDGTQQIVIRDEKGRAVGGKYHRSGRKIQIHLCAFSDLVWDNKDFVVDYSELPGDRLEQYKKNHDDIRKAAMDMDYQLEIEYFTKHIKERAEKLKDDDEWDVSTLAKDFYDKNLNPYIKIPDDIPIIGESHITRKNKQWEREIEVIYTQENGLEIRRKHESAR